jgi:Ser/Thr protein kinase RdoA (MazF antagonist)
MTPAPLDLAARKVLQRYSRWLRPTLLVTLGNAGGFSGARLWRIECVNGAACLRAWPAGSMTSDALTFLHSLMRQARGQGLHFVPAIHPTDDGATWIQHGGRLWELSTWQTGRADFSSNPSPQRLRAACVALAQLHVAWSQSGQTRGVCPAAERRLARCSEWSELIASGWRGPLHAPSDELVHPVACRAWKVLVRHVHRVPLLLQPWIVRTFPLQPCLCDVWHDHLLFHGDTLSGLIDYGAAKIDQVAVDLARLLGSLVGDDREAWAIGLAAYREVRGLDSEEEALAVVLARTGTILGAANWLLWLYRDRRKYEDAARVTRRLETLVARMEAWDK